MARLKSRIELDRQWVLAVGVSFAAPRVNETLIAIKNRSQIETPVNTGNLRSRTQKTMRARRTYVLGTVENKVKYARWVHEGTRAHDIVARRKQALRFESPKGFIRFAKRVHHPGTKPRPFLTSAMYQEAPKRGFMVTRGTTGPLVAST
jgi:hypothetical protein